MMFFCCCLYAIWCAICFSKSFVLAAEQGSSFFPVCIINNMKERKIRALSLFLCVCVHMRVNSVSKRLCANVSPNEIQFDVIYIFGVGVVVVVVFELLLSHCRSVDWYGIGVSHEEFVSSNHCYYDCCSVLLLFATCCCCHFWILFFAVLR